MKVTETMTKDKAVVADAPLVDNFLVPPALGFVREA